MWPDSNVRRFSSLKFDPRPAATLIRGSRHHHLRQQLLALRLRTVADPGGGETLENAVLERGDDGVVHVALAADRRRVGKLVGGGTDRFQHLPLAAAPAGRR